MPRMSHGEIPPIGPESAEANGEVNRINTNLSRSSDPKGRFGYMFESVAAFPENRLPELQVTVDNLRLLGESMIDPGPGPKPGIPVPTVYTFFGQFIDHDITFEKASDKIRNISDNNLTPIPPDRIRDEIKNYRSPDLDLDSVYDPPADFPPAVKQDGTMVLGKVSLPGSLPPGKDVFNDLPRAPKSSDKKKDRAALIGDPRNDENLILAQMHVAFLRAHNALIRKGYQPAEARTLLRRHYQYLVLNDFLNQIADPLIVRKVRLNGGTFFNPLHEEIFMPLEFSGAAYRFGHSKLRDTYRKFNSINDNAKLTDLFTFTRLSGGGGGPEYDNIPGLWVIDWTSFLQADRPELLSRPIDLGLAPSLANLKAEGGADMNPPNLATRNLLRGYILGLPTGQAVARAMTSAGIQPMSEDQIGSVAISSGQYQILKNSGFLKKTPLFIYCLAEAAFYNKGHHLGPVGSTIVAEVLIGILWQSTDSILADPSWRPTLGQTPGEFTFADLFKLAGVL